MVFLFAHNYLQKYLAISSEESIRANRQAHGYIDGRQLVLFRGWTFLALKLIDEKSPKASACEQLVEQACCRQETWSLFSSHKSIAKSNNQPKYAFAAH